MKTSAIERATERTVRLLPCALLIAATATAEPLRNLDWTLPEGARIEGSTLIAETPAGTSPRTIHCEAPLDLSSHLVDGLDVVISVRVRARDVTKPDARWNGVKAMLRYAEAETGILRWPGAKLPIGTFDWTNASTRVSEALSLPPEGGKATLILGLQGCTGHAEFDLDSLEITKQASWIERVNRDYVVRYPVPSVPAHGRVTNDEGRVTSAVRDESLVTRHPSPVTAAELPTPLRGCMLPARDTAEADIAQLAAWGATMARFQIMRNWFMDNDCQDLDEYAAWIDRRLDNLADVLRWAEARGMKICIDLHSPPGGKRPGDRAMNMFFEEKWANAFVETWKRIATRFKGHPAIYGYDLVNEPDQKVPAPISYWEIQRRAAEAVRAIDPDTPIIVESNLAAAPSAYRYLSPLAMDNVIYQIHVYAPSTFTHQGVTGHPRASRPGELAWPGGHEGETWNRDFLRQRLRPARDFQAKHKCKIYVGEFSAITWAEGAENYLRDAISLFEEYGWDWTYHAFRESPIWDVEKVSLPKGGFAPSDDNPRKRVLLDGFRGVTAPQQ